MVFLRVQSIICLELHKKVSSSSPKCKRESIWETLENALKNGRKGANGCKISPIENMKVRVNFLVYLVKRVHRKKDKCVWCALDDTLGIPCKGALQDLYKDPPKSVHEIALKGALQVPLEKWNWVSFIYCIWKCI